MDHELVERIERMVRLGEIADPERARIHALTRKNLTFTDADIAYMVAHYIRFSDINGPLDAQALLRHMRDRYEDSRLYAPPIVQTKAHKVSDEEMDAIEVEISRWNSGITLASALRDLRDRYEERGRYAPPCWKPR